MKLRLHSLQDQADDGTEGGGGNKEEKTLFTGDGDKNPGKNYDSPNTPLEGETEKTRMTFSEALDAIKPDFPMNRTDRSHLKHLEDERKKKLAGGNYMEKQ